MCRDTLEAHGVITMEGGMFQQFMIQPSQVNKDGQYTTTREVTGVQTGVWGATVTVVTQPFNVCLQDDNNAQTVLLINSYTGVYTFSCEGCFFRGPDQWPTRQRHGDHKRLHDHLRAQRNRSTGDSEDRSVYEDWKRVGANFFTEDEVHDHRQEHGEQYLRLRSGM